MSLRLITGSANAGKTGEVLREAQAAVNAGGSPTIVVPRALDARRLESELAQKTSLGIDVVTWGQFVRGQWVSSGDGRRFIAPHTRDAIIERLLIERVEPALDSVAQTLGFKRLLSGWVQEPLEAECRGRGGGTSARAIAELMDAYRRALRDAGLIEAGWASALLADEAPELPGPLGVTRFDTLSPGELRLLVGLSKRSQVTVALTWEAGFAPTRANNSLVELLSDVAVEHVALQEREDSREIAALGRALFLGPASLVSCGNVVAGVASGGEAEAGLVARFIRGAMDQGTPAGRIVVAFPNPGGRLAALRAAFRAAEIPSDFDVPERLCRTPYGRAYCGLLALAAGEGSRDDAMTYIASPYSGVGPDAMHELDRHWRQTETTEARRLLNDMKNLGGRTQRCVRAAEAVARSAVILDGMKSWKQLGDSLLEASYLGAPEARDDRITADGAACQAVMRTVLEMAQAPHASFQASDVLRTLRRVLVSGKSDESLDRVQVCAVETVGARRFDVVIVGGLTNAEAPVSSGDSVEAELGLTDSTFGGEDRTDLNRLKFYSLLTRARERLVLIRQDADNEGRDIRASQLWEDVFDAYRQPGDTPNADTPEAIPCVRLTRAQVEELAPALTCGRAAERLAAREMQYRPATTDKATSSDGLDAMALERAYSATEVETYLGCPYKWFYERVVRPEEIDKELDAREVGTQAHRLIAAFCRRLGVEGVPRRVSHEWADEALSLFDEVARQESGRMARPSALGGELAAARAVAWARNVVSQDASFLPGFVPAHAELEFGYGTPFEFAGASFRGRIDRVDVSSASIFVTDYKTSREVVGLSRLESEGRVQAVIYARAAEEALGLPVSGSAYRSMRSGRLGGFWRGDLLEMPQGMCEDDAIGEQGFEELTARTEERVARAIDGMRAGRMPRVAAVKGTCAYCAVSAFCEGAR